MNLVIIGLLAALLWKLAKHAELMMKAFNHLISIITAKQLNLPASATSAGKSD